MTAAERTTMTDKTPPYVTTFDQIKPGQLIEREWAFRGIRFRTEGIAHHLSPDSEGQWLTVDGGIVANRPDSTDALRVLAESSLPTTWGATIRIKGGEFDGRTAVLADLGMTTFPWLTQSDDGESYQWASGAEIPDWTVVYDPSAPKTDDGLREDVEQLVEGLTRRGEYHAGAANDFQRGKGDGLMVAVESLRHLLGTTETGADA